MYIGTSDTHCWSKWQYASNGTYPIVFFLFNCANRQLPPPAFFADLAWIRISERLPFLSGQRQLLPHTHLLRIQRSIWQPGPLRRFPFGSRYGEFSRHWSQWSVFKVSSQKFASRFRNAISSDPKVQLWLARKKFCEIRTYTQFRLHWKPLSTRRSVPRPKHVLTDKMY